MASRNDPTGTGMHPCSRWSESDITFATKEEAGLCGHHYNSTSKKIEYDYDYNLLLNALQHLNLLIFRTFLIMKL